MLYRERNRAFLASTLLFVAAGCSSTSRSIGKAVVPSTAPPHASSGQMTPLVPDVPLDPEGALTLPAALARARRSHPHIAASSWERAAAAGRMRQAAVLPNPEVEVEVEEFSGDNPGLRSAETTISLSQPVPLGGRLSSQSKAARVDMEYADAQGAALEMSLTADVCTAFVRLLGAQETLGLAEETVRIAQEAARATDERIAAGAASPVERTQAQLALATARSELDDARGAHAAARLRLAAMWGSSTPGFSSAVGSLDDAVHLPPLPELRETLVSAYSVNSQLALQRLEVARRKAALELAEARRFPDLRLTAGYRRIERERVNTFIAGVALPIPLFDRNQGGIDEARAHVAKAEWDERATRVHVYVQLEEVYAALGVALAQRAAYARDILPGAHDAFQAIDAGYREGKFNYLEFLDAQRTLAQARGRHVEILVRVQELRIQLEHLLGASVSARAQSMSPVERTE